MKTMPNSPRLTMRIDPDLRDWLNTEAKRQDRSASYIAKQAILDAKDRTEAKVQMIREAIEEADKGEFISEEKMTAWMESWDTPNEIPAPEPDIFLHRS